MLTITVVAVHYFRKQNENQDKAGNFLLVN